METSTPPPKKGLITGKTAFFVWNARATGTPVNSPILQTKMDVSKPTNLLASLRQIKTKELCYRCHAPGINKLQLLSDSLLLVTGQSIWK
jgi:hypothetical protein